MKGLPAIEKNLQSTYRTTPAIKNTSPSKLSLKNSLLYTFMKKRKVEKSSSPFVHFLRTLNIAAVAGMKPKTINPRIEQENQSIVSVLRRITHSDALINNPVNPL